MSARCVDCGMTRNCFCDYRDIGPKFATAKNPSAEQVVTDPSAGGRKDQKPERYDLLPFEALDEIARVYHFGATERGYGPHNWRGGYEWSKSVAALCRHVSEWMQGRDRDAQSGLHHMAHAAFHCMSLITFDKLKLGTDDRSK